MKGNTFYVNKITYDSIVNNLGYEPSNLKVNPYIRDNQAIVIDNMKLEDFMKPKILPLSHFNEFDDARLNT